MTASADGTPITRTEDDGADQSPVKPTLTVSPAETPEREMTELVLWPVTIESALMLEDVERYLSIDVPLPIVMLAAPVIARAELIT